LDTQLGFESRPDMVKQDVAAVGQSPDRIEVGLRRFLGAQMPDHQRAQVPHRLRLRLSGRAGLQDDLNLSLQAGGNGSTTEFVQHHQTIRAAH